MHDKYVHLPTSIPPHSKCFSAMIWQLCKVFCSSLAESQIFLKVLAYHFNVINETKIKWFFFSMPQGTRQSVHWRYMNNGHIYIPFGILWAFEVTAVCSLLGLLHYFYLVSKFTCLLSFAFTTKAHILKYCSCQKKQDEWLPHCHSLFNSENPQFEEKILFPKCIL